MHEPLHVRGPGDPIGAPAEATEARGEGRSPQALEARPSESYDPIVVGESPSNDAPVGDATRPSVRMHVGKLRSAVRGYAIILLNGSTIVTRVP